MKPRRLPAAMFAYALALPILLAAACGPGSPEERVESTRARYEATLMGWVVREEPPPAVLELAEGELEEGIAEDEARLAVAEEQAPPAGPVPRDVTLNLQLWHNSPEMLPGITLDVSHADEQEREKEVYRVWVDTSQLMRGQHIQLDHVLRGILIEPGDRFSVRVRHPVPAADRGEYREFQEI